MPKQYKNDSPAMRFLDRGDHLMRLQDRALMQMRNDTELEYQEVVNVVISPNTDPKKFVRETMARLKKSQARFADIELMLQIFFCRHYDNFEIFLEELIGDIARREPQLLDGIKLRKADEMLPADEKFEKRIEKVARLPIGQLTETIADEMSFDLFASAEVLSRVTYISNVRNLLTHRYGVVDRHFLTRHPACGLEVGSKFVVTMEFTRDVLHDLTKAAADTQKRAEARFRVHYQTTIVGQTEWWEEPDTPLPKLPSPDER